MIQLNIVSRISDDKNCFFDIIYVLYKLKEQNVDDVKVLFIGDIITETLYKDMIKLIKLFDLSDRISFTKHSIRFNDLSESVKQGYFLNLTIGDFKGYSGIESIKMGFKTIFYNADKGLSAQTNTSESQSVDMAFLILLILKIKADPVKMDRLIISDNLRMKNEFLLNECESLLLRSILTPPARS